MRTIEEIVAMYNHRRRVLGPVHDQMLQVRELARGDVIVPLNELDKNAKASVANLLSVGLDQMSMRVASTMPHPYFPPIKEGSQRSKELASLRHKAMLSMWDQNRMNMKLRRRARHLGRLHAFDTPDRLPARHSPERGLGAVCRLVSPRPNPRRSQGCMTPPSHRPDAERALTGPTP